MLFSILVYTPLFPSSPNAQVYQNLTQFAQFATGLFPFLLFNFHSLYVPTVPSQLH